MAFKAIHKHARISARKVRLVADLIRGKFADEALDILRYQPERGARMLEKVLKSAIGNAQDPEKQVHIDLFLEEGSLVVRVADEGTGFDPALIHDPLAPENLLRPNGRGIFYMKSFMDEIHYGSRPGGGTVVTLRKRITRAQENPAGHLEGTE